MSIDRIGLSGIQAADINLHNTAHNIANSETPWFTRMNPVLVTEQGHWADYLRQHGGVSVRQLLRMSSEFLNNQVFLANSSTKEAETVAATMSTMDHLLSNENTGLSSVLSDFTGDLQRAEPRPESLSLREQWIGTAKRLTARFHSLDQQLETTLEHQQVQIAGLVKEANRLTENIARLNQQITELTGSQIDSQNRTSDLQDQRDKLINELSAKISVDLLFDDNNSVTLSLRTPQGNLPVVAGKQYWSLSYQAKDNKYEPTVILHASGADIAVHASAGEMAGLQQLGKHSLLNIFNQLGWQSILLAGNINEQLMSGDDLTGAVGSPLFNNINAPEAISRRVMVENVQGDGRLTVEISSLDKLIPSDYRLRFTKIASDGNEFIITRLSDGNQEKGKVASGDSLIVDGLTINLDGTPTAQDQYLITPWQHQAKYLEVLLNDPEALAFASSGGGPGDNRNLQLLISRLTGHADTSATPDSLYTRLKSVVANETATAQEQNKTSQHVYNTAINERESLSGVNMEDEAANLIRFQQFYRANARVIQVNRALIDDLLSMFF